ncbi:MAG: 16S rRNA (adenine(1518)-N(6)/adenine(1519)-N(6))-dimethyltransferase RsmA [Patescibacteria group bacterium]
MIPAKKSLGQNFLKSQGALREIIQAARIENTDVILEIGPGKGALTKLLIEHAGKVIAIEKDTRLIPYLKEEFKEAYEQKKLEIHEQDILEFDPAYLKADGQYYKLVANIPYYLTGIIFRKFLETHYQPSLMVLLVQKEVAQRIVARDEKESILSLSVKAYGTPKYIGKVAAKYFSPQPKVDSAILLIDSISRDFFNTITEEEFFTVIKAGFAHKRKMLAGNLHTAFPEKDISNALISAGINEKARAEDVGLLAWKKLTEILR